MLFLALLYKDALADCEASHERVIWISPRQSHPGEDILIKAVSADQAIDQLRIGVDGHYQQLAVDSRGGPPWSLTAAASLPSSSLITIEALAGGQVIDCQKIVDDQEARLPVTAKSWSRATEAFYSAWVEQLFDGDIASSLSFKSLEPVLRDPDRNFLFEHLGMDEDRSLPAHPDCADLPYYLRTYFAWKIGLPISYRACDRGTSQRPPHCSPAIIDKRFTRGPVPASQFVQLMRTMADTVHSGSARTALADDNTDFYPVPLDRESLWPGTVFADPYGHTLILSRWLPNNTKGPGRLLGVDAQPDHSVTRKTFWEGNFLFVTTDNAGPGFKAFRPLSNMADHDQLLDNASLIKHALVAPFSTAQSQLRPDDFYAAMATLINPKGLSPEVAFEAKRQALIEQIETRVTAVETGESYMRQHRGTIMTMPSGPKIFETTGPWEDYASPSRDMRLLIALKVLQEFQGQALRHPELFLLEGRSQEAVKELLATAYERSLNEDHFDYLRSDGSHWTLSVKELMDRKSRLETAYNPNDCPEHRWGALPDTPEYETCHRHAPEEQTARMGEYRNWFKSTQRPSR